MFNVYWTDGEGNDHHAGFTVRLLAESAVARLQYNGFRNVQSDLW